MMVKDENHIPILNLLRAIASLGVCVVHMHYAVNLQHYPIGKILAYGQLGVPIFFVISGFVVPYSLWASNYSIKNFFRYLLKRSVRIDPPYLAIIMICLLLGRKFNLIKLFLHLFYLVPFSNYEWYEGVFWTLGVEFQFYIIIGILFPFIKYGNIKILLFFLLTISFTGYHIPIEKNYAFILHHIHYFCFGIIVTLFKMKRLSQTTTNVFLLILTVYLCLTISYITGAIGLLSAIFIMYLNIEYSITNFLAKISYSLYLTHSISGDLIQPFFEHLTKNRYLLLIELVAFNIFFATIFYFIIEKVALRWSKSIRIDSKQQTNYNIGWQRKGIND